MFEEVEGVLLYRHRPEKAFFIKKKKKKKKKQIQWHCLSAPSRSKKHCELFPLTEVTRNMEKVRSELEVLMRHARTH